MFACQAIYPLMKQSADKAFGHTESQGGLISEGLCTEQTAIPFPLASLQVMNAQYQSFYFVLSTIDKWNL